MIKPLTSFLLLLAFSSLASGHTYSKEKYKKSVLKQIAADIADLKPQIDELKSAVALLQQCVNTPKDDPNIQDICVPPPEEDKTHQETQDGQDPPPVKDRTSLGVQDDIIFAASQYLNTGSTRCGPLIMTNCVRTLDAYASNAVTAITNNQYTNTGTCFFSAPTAGYYNICFHARFQQGGNSGDVTIAAGSQQYAAAFGDADQRDWRSTGTCFIYFLSLGQQVYGWARHGGGSDCIEETSWRYGIFSVHLIAATV